MHLKLLKLVKIVFFWERNFHTLQKFDVGYVVDHLFCETFKNLDLSWNFYGYIWLGSVKIIYMFGGSKYCGVLPFC